MSLRNTLILNAKNLPGRSCNRKLIVIECDDWGSSRLPSAEVYNELVNSGVPLNKNHFNRIDTLADKEDLDSLFDVMLSVKDKNGHNAVMTPVVNVANPDFGKIREASFLNYFYEPFTETLRRYNRHPDTFKTWKKGIELGIFLPELHGREHISVQFWLKELQDGNEVVRKAFDHEFVAVSLQQLNPVLDQFRPEFYFNNNDQISFLKNSISSGVNIFKDLFGYIPCVFVPGNSVFHPVLEKDLIDNGIKYLYGNTFNPTPGKNGRIRYMYFRNGRKTSDGLTYYTRNCAFEPSDPGYRGIEFTLKQIETAFRWNKPANISTHRVNFVGAIDKRNREKGLLELKMLLDSIVKNWPDAEFVSSAEMLSELYPMD